MSIKNINIGLTPNDGTGTKWRQAWDWVNQMFQELYSSTNNLENNYAFFQCYSIIASGTTGQITKSANSIIQLNKFGNGIDAILTKLDSNQIPIDEEVKDAIGNVVDTSFDVNGNYVFDYVPAQYPVGIVFYIIIKDKYRNEISIDSIIESGVLGSKQIDAINVLQNNLLRFVSDLQISNWNAKINSSLLGVVNGVATIDALNLLSQNINASKITGIIPISNIPKAALERLYYYTGLQTSPENMGLTSTQVQNGDTIKVKNTLNASDKLMWMVIDEDNLNLSTSFEAYTTQSASSVPFSGITGFPTSIPNVITNILNDLIVGNGLGGWQKMSYSDFKTLLFNGFIDSSDPNATKFKILSPNTLKLIQIAVDQLWNTAQVYTNADNLELWSAGWNRAKFDNVGRFIAQTANYEALVTTDQTFTNKKYVDNKISSISSNLQILGDGSDGDVVISVNTTLTTDMYYNNLTINVGITLTTGSFRIFVIGTLLNNGTIRVNASIGSNAVASVGGNGGIGVSALSVGGSTAGTSGITGLIGAGTSATPATTINAGQGGQGGLSGVGGSGASGNGGGASNGGIVSPFKVRTITFYLARGTNLLQGGGGGRGGSSGAGDGINLGGGGGGAGAGGGIIWLAVNILNNLGIISANGAIGGNGGTATVGDCGGGGGGAGGGGGYIHMYVATITSLGNLQVNGGVGGSGGLKSGTGTNGGAGGTGLIGHISYYNLSTNTWTNL